MGKRNYLQKFFSGLLTQSQAIPIPIPIPNPILDLFFTKYENGKIEFGGGYSYVSDFKWKNFQSKAQEYEDLLSSHCQYRPLVAPPVTQRPTLSHLHKDHDLYLPMSEMVYLQDRDFDVVHLIFPAKVKTLFKPEKKIFEQKLEFSNYLNAAVSYEIYPLLVQYRKDTQKIISSSMSLCLSETDQENMNELQRNIVKNIITKIDALVPYVKAVWPGDYINLEQNSNRGEPERITCNHVNYLAAYFMYQSFALAIDAEYNIEDKKFIVKNYPKFQFGENNDGETVEAIHLYEDAIRAAIKDVDAPSSNEDLSIIDCIKYGTVEEKIKLLIAAFDMLPQLQILINQQHMLITSPDMREQEQGHYSNVAFTPEQYAEGETYRAFLAVALKQR
ncbi:MAG: hypothetical protein ACK5XX_00800 [Holosporales bacterium]|jgi:hypothetical protein